MPTSRSERRQANYHTYRQMGYSAREARRLRDVSPRRGAEIVERDRRQISRVRVSQRTPQQQARLDAIREYRTNQRIINIHGDVRDLTKSERRNNFADWSRRNIGFPPRYQRQIDRINRRRGYPPGHWYGYVHFYHQYVNGENEFEAAIRAERRDT